MLVPFMLGMPGQRSHMVPLWRLQKVIVQTCPWEDCRCSIDSFDGWWTDDGWCTTKTRMLDGSWMGWTKTQQSFQLAQATRTLHPWPSWRMNMACKRWQRPCCFIFHVPSQHGCVLLFLARIAKQKVPQTDKNQDRINLWNNILDDILEWHKSHQVSIDFRLTRLSRFECEDHQTAWWVHQSPCWRSGGTMFGVDVGSDVTDAWIVRSWCVKSSSYFGTCGWWNQSVVKPDVSFFEKFQVELVLRPVLRWTNRLA